MSHPSCWGITWTLALMVRLSLSHSPPSYEGGLLTGLLFEVSCLQTLQSATYVLTSFTTYSTVTAPSAPTHPEVQQSTLVLPAPQS